MSSSGFNCLSGKQNKNESKKDRQILESWQRSENVVEHKCDGVLGIDCKALRKRLGELEIRGRIETIQTTVLLRSASILRKVLET